jgi:hypothetical protein
VKWLRRYLDATEPALKEFAKVVRRAPARILCGWMPRSFMGRAVFSKLCTTRSVPV